PDAVHGRDVQAVRDGVTPLDRPPGVELLRAMAGLLLRVPADGRGIEQDARPLERRKPRALGVPLVPADERADPPDPRVEDAEAEIPGREVELLVVCGIVGDVHLAVQADQASVGINHGRGVVVETRGAPLENWGDDHDSGALRHLAEHVRGGPGDGLRQVEQGRVPQSGAYHVIRRYALGGDGGWDYLTLDTASHRLYIARGTRVIVIDADSGSLVGEIPNTPGVHGVALVPELHRGFASAGRD